MQLNHGWTPMNTDGMRQLAGRSAINPVPSLSKVRTRRTPAPCSRLIRVHQWFQMQSSDLVLALHPHIELQFPLSLARCFKTPELERADLCHSRL